LRGILCGDQQKRTKVGGGRKKKCSHSSQKVSQKNELWGEEIKCGPKKEAQREKKNGIGGGRKKLDGQEYHKNRIVGKARGIWVQVCLVSRRLNTGPRAPLVG